MQRARERIMVQVTWRDEKQPIRKQTDAHDILEEISRQRWAGPLRGMQTTRDKNSTKANDHHLRYLYVKNI